MATRRRGSSAPATQPIGTAPDPTVQTMGDVKTRNIAAANRVCGEILQTFLDSQATMFEEEIKVPSVNLAVDTGSGWRQIGFNQGHRLFWKGKARSGAKGNLLFQFEPAMNSELEARGARVVEIPYERMSAIIGHGLNNWLTDNLGATIAELLSQAYQDLAPDDIQEARNQAPEPEVKPDEATVMQDWGAFA